MDAPNKPKTSFPNRYPTANIAAQPRMINIRKMGPKRRIIERGFLATGGWEPAAGAWTPVGGVVAAGGGPPGAEV